MTTDWPHNLLSKLDQQHAIIRDMMIDDYDAVIALWQKSEFMQLNECDTREGIAFYLHRNPGLCFVAESDGLIVGSVLCGHDGRRGFLRHLAVAKACRQSGLGRQLVTQVMNALDAQAIGKCNIFVDNSNESGFSFWQNMGWSCLRRNLSHDASSNASTSSQWAYAHA